MPPGPPSASRNEIGEGPGPKFRRVCVCVCVCVCVYNHNYTGTLEQHQSDPLSFGQSHGSGLLATANIENPQSQKGM